MLLVSLAWIIVIQTSYCLVLALNLNYWGFRVLGFTASSGGFQPAPGYLCNGSVNSYQTDRWLVNALSMFEIQGPNPTSGAMIAMSLSFALPPSSVPRFHGQERVTSKIGSVKDLNAYKVLGTRVVVASTFAIVTVGRSGSGLYEEHVTGPARNAAVVWPLCAPKRWH